MTRARTIPILHDEHVAIGGLVWAMEDDLIMIADAVGAAYGARLTDAVLQAERAIGSALVALDAKYWREHPDAQANPYGWPKDRDIKTHQQRDRRADLRQKATTIIEPAIAYEPPPDRRAGNRLNGALLFREHIVIGSILGQMRHDLMALFIHRLQHAYGKSDPTTDRTRKAVGKLDRLRSLLDGKVCAEHPRYVDAVEGICLTHVYYNAASHRHPVDRPFLLPQGRFELQADPSRAVWARESA